MAIKIDWAGSSLNKNMSSMDSKLATTVLMFARTHANSLESYMKLNRPWIDRTGMAKATLSTNVSQPDKNLVRITLAHGVSYGIWLELAHEKNYAIIGPTINSEGPKIFDEFNDLMLKLV